jgi:putative DNA primase/helicase
LTNGKWKKPPIDCHTGRRADKTNPEVLANFADAYDYYQEHENLDGIGFVFTPDGPFTGVDMDDCRDPITGRLDPKAEELIRSFNSYGEVSPSLTGAKLWVRGKLPPGSRKRGNSLLWPGDIEMYSADAYFTVTGMHLSQTPTTVEDRQQRLLDVYEQVFGKQEKVAGRKPAAETSVPLPHTQAGPEDTAILAQAMKASNGDEFTRLFLGNTDGFPSESEADLALCRRLAFWVGPDEERIERLFNLSALAKREKWRDREDYRRRTIQTAMEDQTAFYRPPSPSPMPVEPICIDTPNEAPDDPHRLARLFVQQCCHTDGLTLRYWRDEWHRWSGTAYKVVPEKEIRANLCEAIKGEFNRVNLQELMEYQQKGKNGQLRRGDELPMARKVTQGLVGNVLQALAGRTVLPASTEQPAWLEGDGFAPAEEVLAATNGLFHLPTLEFHPPTPTFFSPNVLDYPFDPDAAEPRAWLDFLGQLWPNDPQSIETLQEWFGYCLLPDTSQQKMLLLVGPKRSGKGTIARVLKGLIGANNLAGPTLSSLATSFGLWPLLGKTVAVVSDARLSGRTDATVITERLLSISGEDTLTVDRKHLPPVSVKLPTRFVILTNELPKVNDSSGALAGRMLLLRLTASFYGQEDPGLTQRLLTELPGILLWAVEGWRRLRERRHFVQPDSGRELMVHLEDLGSPVNAFIRECCVVGPDQRVAKADLYQRWTAWCQSGGREHPGDAATFGRNLVAAIPTISTSQPRVDGKRMNVYAGIGVATL